MNPTLEIVQLPYQHVPKNNSFSISPTLVVSENVTWSKVLGPDWASVNSTSGEITGTSDDTGDAHYIQIKATGVDDYHLMTFILVVGNQTVWVMDGQGANPSTIREAYSNMASGDVLIIPSGIYNDSDNSINGQLGQ